MKLTAPLNTQFVGQEEISYILKFIFVLGFIYTLMAATALKSRDISGPIPVIKLQN